jgi:flagellar basal-body rod protein FlgC
LTASTLKLTASASNVANADDTSAVGTNGYQPTGVVQSAAPGGGVFAQAVTLSSPSLVVFDPTSPIAGAQGMLDTPDIDPISEISNQLAASQAFAFSLKVLQFANDEEQSAINMTA